MKKTILVLLLILAKLSVGFAQCTEMFDFKEGTEWEWTYYDKKGKFQSKTIQKVEKYAEVGNGFEVTLSVVSIDNKGEEMPKQTMDMSCKNGIVYFDMKKFVPSQYAEESGGDMQMEVKGDNLEMPIDMQAGDRLKDASVSLKIGGGDSPMNINMTIDIFNRKVEAEETLTTPAGTFDCFVLTQSIKTKVIMTIQVESKEWYSPGVGMVKSESYRKGKMMGYSLLTKFSQ